MGKKKKVTVGYKYFMGLHMGLGRGPFDLIREIRVGDKTAWLGNATGNTTIKIDKPDLFGGEEQEGGIQGDLVVLMGAKDQQRHAGLAQMLGGLVSAFRGVVTTYFDGMVCAMSQYPKPWAYRVRRIQMGWHGGECWYPEKAAIKLGERMLISGSDRPWRYLVVPNSDATDRSATAFDDSAWPSGKTPFASRPWDIPGLYGFATIPATTVPEASKVWMRTWLDLGEVPQQLRFQAFVDNDCRVYVNGTFVLEVGGNNGAYYDVNMPTSAFVAGRNSIAVVGWDRHSGPGNWYWFDWRMVDSTNDDLFGMNPAHILYQVYTDPRMGRGLLPAARLDDAAWRAAADAFSAEGLGLCMKWARSGPIAEFAQQVIDHAGAALYTSRRTGKLVLKPIRDDYDIDDLPLFTPDTGLLGIDDDASSAQAQGVNEIVVKYFDPFDKREKAIRERNLGAILAADGVAVTEEVSYPGLATEALARRIARRDLNAKGGFIKRFEVRLDRRGKDIPPGGVFRISDPARGIDSMVLRAGSVDYGTATGGTITVTALQDVFGMPATVLREHEDSGYVPPDTTPRAITQQRVIEAPYRDLVQRLGANDADALDPTAGYLLGLAVAPSGMSLAFDLHTRVAPADFALAASGAFCPGARLAAVLRPMDTTMAVSSGTRLADVQPGTAALVNGEIVRVDAVDMDAGLLVVGRGCADTLPALHALGSHVFFYDTFGEADATEYTQGVSVEARLLTRTTAGVLPLASASTQTATFAARAIRPYPPGRVLFNGNAYPDAVVGSVATTWAHRDRRTQADGLIDAAAASIGPEPGTSYEIHYFSEEGGTPIASETGMTGTAATAWTPPGPGRYRAELYSRRNGLRSLQQAVHTFQWGAQLWTPSNLASPPALWLDATAGVAQDGAGGCSTWTDAYGQSMSQGNAGFRPRVVTGLGGLPALSFEGDDYLASDETSIARLCSGVNAAWTLVVFDGVPIPGAEVAKTILSIPSPERRPRWELNAGYGNVYPYLYLGRLDSGPWSSPVGLSSPVQSAVLMASMDFITGAAQMETESGLSSAGTGSGGGPTSATTSATVGLGGIVDGQNLHRFIGRMSCVLFGNGTLPSRDEVDKLMGWAAHRWGLTANLPADHPYKHQPPTVTDPGVPGADWHQWPVPYQQAGTPYGICWSPTLQLYCAVGDGLSSGKSGVMTSPDGEQWTARQASFQGSFMSVCWSPELGLFAAVSPNSLPNKSVMTSPDGLTWTTRQGVASSGFTSICWSPERHLFVAVALLGAGGETKVMTSPDGETWTARQGGQGCGWAGVCWSPQLQLFVAVASFAPAGVGRVMTSPDGVSWTQRATPANFAGGAVCWSPGLSRFVAIGGAQVGSTMVSTSPDGQVWSSTTLPESYGNSAWHSIAWSDAASTLCAVGIGSGRPLMTSQDGVAWTQAGGFGGNYSGVCWSPERSQFCAVSIYNAHTRDMT
jgi:hypothetical protein